MWPRNVLGVTEAHGLTGNLMRRAKWGIVDIWDNGGVRPQMVATKHWLIPLQHKIRFLADKKGAQPVANMLIVAVSQSRIRIQSSPRMR